MIFLPVVERELRVAARKRNTFWSRIAAAIVTLIFGAGILTLVGAIGSTFTTPAIGKFLFTALTWLSLATALFAGVFFTSDCLSEEKREGTLGFLFLTDLRGYDVVLGKLLATSLRGFYTFFAVLPVLAITLLMGGVTGDEFWRVCVALLSALFFSLAVGMFVSTLSREPQKALGGTVFLLVLLCGLGPAADTLIRPMRPTASLSSPVYLFLTAGWTGQAQFGHALLVNQIIAFVLLGVSCVLLPRTWQVKATKTAMAGETWARWWRYGSARRRQRLRALMDINPVLWLASRERWQGMALWIITCLMAGVVIATIKVAPMAFAWGYLSGALHLALYLAVAADSGRFFVAAQRTGLTELLLATPLNERDIVRGHWRGLLRIYLLPLLVCLGVQFTGTTISQQKTYQQMAAVTATTTVVTNNTVVVVTNIASATPAAGAAGAITEHRLARLMPFFSAALTTVTTVANLLALCWFGMWMGMTSKKSNFATLKTFVFVQIIPWFAITFGSTLLTMLVLMPRMFMGNTGNVQWMIWYPFLSAAVTTVLCVLKDAGFIFWSRRKLLSDFRLRATQTVLPVAVLPPRLAPQPPPLKP